ALILACGLLLAVSACTRFGFSEERVLLAPSTISDARSPDARSPDARSYDVRVEGLHTPDALKVDTLADESAGAFGDGSVGQSQDVQSFADVTVDLTLTADSAPSRVRVLIGIQESTHSIVAAYDADLLGEVAVADGVYDLTDNPFLGSGLRAFSQVGSSFLLGSYTNANQLWRFSELMVQEQAITLTGRVGGELSDVMGLCVLSDGHLIVSSYGQGQVAEYAASGSYLRDVVSTTYHMSDCVATGPGEIIIVDADANSDERGLLRKLRRGADDVWAESQRFELTTVGGTTRSSAWTLLYAKGRLYVPPLHPGGGGTARMVVCAGGDLAACAEFGSPVPRVYPEGAIEAIGQIPGSDELLLADHQRLMKYRVDGTLVELADISRPELGWLRKLQVVVP
ncbi:MAG: hypothetical protein JRH20_27680, partial [Deltaproteobacteria bacterium]|nr:hypothetical protein [Deltaproteobacteria bacterium]